MEANLYSPKIKSKTKKAIKKMLNQKPIKEQRVIVEQNYLMNPNDIHNRIPRVKYFGERVEMDASVDYWLGKDNPKLYLHASVDCSTGRLLGAYFSNEELLQSYYIVLGQIISKFGVPAILVTDNRTIFYSSYTRNTGQESRTNFALTCKRLSIDLQTTSVPQKKGRIERLFQTLQSRLPVDLRLNGITTMNDANKFLLSYIDEFNESQYGILPINYTTNVFTKLDPLLDLNDILATYTVRTVDKGNTIQYLNNFYYLYNQKGYMIFPREKTKLLIIKTFDQRLYASINLDMYNLVKLDKQAKTSSMFDRIGMKEKKTFIEMTYPFRQVSYE